MIWLTDIWDIVKHSFLDTDLDERSHIRANSGFDCVAVLAHKMIKNKEDHLPRNVAQHARTVVGHVDLKLRKVSECCRLCIE